MPTFGDTSAGGDTFPCSGDRGLLSKFTLIENGDVTALYIRFDSSSTAGTTVKGLIYTDLTGQPDLLLAEGSAVVVPGGGGLVVSTISVSLTPGDYWLGFVADSFEAVAQCDSSGGLSRMEDVTYASPSAIWTEKGTGTAQVNVYAEYTTASVVSVAWLRA
jgi:hypothetical protein